MARLPAPDLALATTTCIGDYLVAPESQAPGKRGGFVSS